MVMSVVEIMVTVTDGTHKVEMSKLEEATGSGTQTGIEPVVGTSKLCTKVFSGETAAAET